MKVYLSIILSCMLLYSTAYSAEATRQHTIQLSSKNKHTTLLEIYSSQGCSSCPPAQRWVNQYENNPALWKTIVPVVFHVDYWDQLGWRDPFASKQFSQRQQEYRRKNKVNSVYTPGFVVEGREWKGWFSGKPLPLINAHHVGQLDVSIDKSVLKLTYQRDKLMNDNKDPLIYNIALLGIGISTQVNKGENAGKTLKENFIVLAHQQTSYARDLPIRLVWDKTQIHAQSYGIAIWITDESLTPLQVVAGDIPKDWVIE
ncbi:MAG: DUF1223 domain-containing protein [Paraglaciecola polaris]|uniref:DUF1223 domain-containing protein n=1 Tax=Paraglaciecola polaris TaxID=222814 RepID=UPI003002FD46